MATLTLAPEMLEFHESAVYATDIMEAYDGTEQRTKLRSNPRRKIEYEYLLPTTEDVERMFAFIVANQTSQIYLPIWWDARPLLVSAIPGDLAVSVDTSYTEFRNGYDVMLRDSDYNVEQKTLNFHDGVSLTFTTTLVSAWTANKAYVVPLVPVVWNSQLKKSQLNRFIDRMTLSFMTP